MFIILGIYQQKNGQLFYFKLTKILFMVNQIAREVKRPANDKYIMIINDIIIFKGDIYEKRFE